ncbi:alkene reductase [Muricoccus pecuniae]|uniref:N-ethylmaleimide reductase n=1 Tax=Muricoccus pecuniae TaxID=693023 RepID=A0A840Y4U1_9PROT|nr:alkene reductase [Roseomonas pecuniae]MBB5695176.1 N-ethylmaleimide reductase [Roseomonas pecuniae]
MPSPAESPLFQPTKIGAIDLANRVAMAPLTRSRALKGDVPRPSAATYYAQRASAGLLITEATQVSDTAKGYAFTPGVYTDAQAEAWRGVTDAVHEKGGRIVVQLWHVGRISHPSLQPGNGQPVAPSAITPKGQAFTETGFQPHPQPRALESEEIAGVVADFAHAAATARRAGFDGVEIHGANGYLIDQFLRNGSNQRTDEYGGSIENRTRFLFEVVEAVTQAIGADRTGLRLSPVTPANDASDSDPAPLFRHAVEGLNRYGLAYLHMIEGATGGPRDIVPDFDFTELRRLFRGPYMANNGYDFAMADAAIREGRADLVAFGRPYIANPDLVERMKAGAPLNEPDRTTFYGGDEHGYTDYPALAA